jgi:hypothetical protein
VVARWLVSRLSLPGGLIAGTVCAEDVARILHAVEESSLPGREPAPALGDAIVHAVLVVYRPISSGTVHREAGVYEFRDASDLRCIRDGLVASKGLVFGPPGPIVHCATSNEGELHLTLRGGVVVTLWINALGFAVQPGAVECPTTFESPGLARTLLDAARRQRGELPQEVNCLLRPLSE